MCPINEDVNQRKLDAVAKFVSEKAASNFRYMLHGLARGKQSKLIEEDLANDEALKKYLIDSGFPPNPATDPPDPLNDEELKKCSKWGVDAADHVKNDLMSERDRKIAERLKEKKNPDGTNPAGLGPIGA